MVLTGRLKATPAGTGVFLTASHQDVDIGVRPVVARPAEGRVTGEAPMTGGAAGSRGLAFGAVRG
jgi:hypothetical protein